MYRTGFREKTWNKQKDVTKERLRGSNIQWSSDYWHVTNTHTRVRESIVGSNIF